MTEDQPPQPSDFITDAARRSGNFFDNHPKTTKALSIGVLGVTGLVGLDAVYTAVTSPTPEQSHIAQVGETTNADKTAFDKLIDDAETKNYDESLVIGDQIKVESGDSNLELHGVARALMDPDYTKDKDAGFEGIKESTTVIGITQPDQIFDVIGVDLKHDGGKEFLVVPDSQIIHHNSDGTAPSPIQSYDLPDVSGGDGSGN